MHYAPFSALPPSTISLKSIHGFLNLFFMVCRDSWLITAVAGAESLVTKARKFNLIPVQTEWGETEQQNY